jgi:hypothetical protein
MERIENFKEDIACIRAVLERILNSMNSQLFLDYEQEKFGRIVKSKPAEPKNVVVDLNKKVCPMCAGRPCQNDCAWFDEDTGQCSVYLLSWIPAIRNVIVNEGKAARISDIFRR